MISSRRCWPWLSVSLVLCLLSGGLGLAQEEGLSTRSAASQSPGYSVSGRVICADTQRPARFAQVTLLSANPDVGEFDRGRRSVGRTDLDGRFVIDNVAPGDYYVAADLTGYVNENNAVQAALSAGGTALDQIAAVPRVQVTAGGGSVQLSLQRGAVLAGSVQWDDGSPAAGVSVSAQPAPASAGGQVSSPEISARRAGLQNFTSRFSGNQTDDRGRFRLSGLAPGAYVVRANLQSPVPGVSTSPSRYPHLLTLRVYAPNKQRQTEGAVYSLAAGEERSDINVVLNLSGMHSVSGQVSSTGASVRSGFVQLTDQTDSSLSRRGDIHADGTFSVPYVPPGNYSLRVTAMAQPSGAARGEGAGVRFQPFQESLTVADSDLSGISVNVTPAEANQ